MKKLIALIVLAITFSFHAQAQDKMMQKEVKTVSLEQTKGAFTQTALTLAEGTYIFEVSNNNAAPEVGLVLVKKGADASNPENHIKTAYVTEVVKKGATQKTNATKLAKGEYVYFCPLNPTPQYTLTVE
ncbi:MAG: cupredoxin domain-containing protein [Bacteroidetes bacterium]|nr:cupredoxin domain-containing protein [Bacteroidota bacterium]